MFSCKLINLFFLCIVIATFLDTVCEGSDRPRIAIIGGGVGGTTAAYELSQLLVEHELDAHMDLFEPNEVGGRLATAFVDGFEFETGGSVIHKENEYMNLFTQRFNLSKYHKPDGQTSDRAGLFDGHKFVFTESRYEMITAVKFLWRYGLDLLALDRDFIRPLLSHFKGVYELQSDKETFENVTDFLATLDRSYLPMLTTSIRDILHSKGYSDLFLNEFVYLATSINYNQNTNIHGFVGAVALAGTQEELWSVKGGNKKIPQALLAHSDANFVNKRVHSVFLMPNSKYALELDENTHYYDYVIIACPIMEDSKTNIEFVGFPQPINIPVNYQRTVATLVHGDINYTFFNYESAYDLPEQIFSVNSELFFNCICVVYPVTPDTKYDRNVFKIFSKKRLTDDQLDLLFLRRNSVIVTDWLAYPQYDTGKKDVTFILHERLFYINAIEWAASAMEMSALSGMNAALHVFGKLAA